MKLGIEGEVALGKVKAALEILVQNQRIFDEEEEDSKAEESVFKPFFELEKKYNQLILDEPDYKLPYSMRLWTRLDVFYHLMRLKDEEFAKVFAKQLARKEVDGKTLLRLVGQKDSVSGLEQCHLNASFSLFIFYRRN